MADYMSDEDDALYRGILDRDTEALARALHVYGPRVMGLMWRRVRVYGTLEDLQDLLQEVAVRIWFHIERFDPDRNNTSFFKWMCQQGIGVAGEFVRKAQRRSKLLSGGLPIVDQNSDSPEERWGRDIDFQRTKARLQRTLMKLSRTDRAVIELYLDDFTTVEIAVQLGLSSGAVRTRLSRARARLASALRDQSDPFTILTQELKQ
jgi:RNA polymerase sigma-70 factor (ECF subfamily)